MQIDFMKVLHGIPVSPGVTLGRALVLEKSLHRVPYLILSKDQMEQQRPLIPMN